jgi:parallel beta-helix repeat protein
MNNNAIGADTSEIYHWGTLKKKAAFILQVKFELAFVKKSRIDKRMVYNMKLNLRPIVWIGFFLAIICVMSSPVFAETFYVSPKGNNNNSGSVNAPWKTLVFAESQLSSGDILYLRGGKYTDTSLTINVPNVIFKNYKDEIPIIDGDFVRPGGSNPTYPSDLYVGLINVTTNNVIIDGITVTEGTGVGINLERATNSTIKNCNVSYARHTGIAVGRRGIDCYNTIDSCNVSFCNYSRDDGSYATWSNIGTNIGLYGNYITVKNCTVSYSPCAGIEGYGDRYSLIENNVVYGNGLTQIHVAMTSNATIRHNLCYGKERPGVRSTFGYGTGLCIRVETWYNGDGWDDGHNIYGNMVANTGIGIAFGWEGSTTDKYYHANTITNCKFYNNTVVESNQNVSDWRKYGIRIEDGGHIGKGNVFKNNIVWQSTGNITYGYANPAKIDVGYNLWNKAPGDSFQDSTDPTYPNYQTLNISDYFEKTSGWNLLKANSLDGTEFNLLPTAVNAINKGTSTPVSSPDNNFLMLSSVNFLAGSFSYLDQTNYGNWEIGAGVYSEAAALIVEEPLSPPTLSIVSN